MLNRTVDLIQKNWTELISPENLTIEKGEDPNCEATIVAEPLERGFGLTLGNALRRVLLSSLEGFAITSVRIEGLDHEFSTISGIVEDVTEIVLNLKQILVK